MRGKKQFPPKIQFVFFSASDFLWVGPDFLKTSKTSDSAHVWNQGKTGAISPAQSSGPARSRELAPQQGLPGTHSPLSGSER
jgi:hypothetical protein